MTVTISRRLLSILIAAVVVGGLVNVATVGLFVWQSWDARQENCRNTEAAFDAYTDALAIQFGRDPDGPEAAEFRDAYEPRLRECA